MFQPSSSLSQSQNALKLEEDYFRSDKLPEIKVLISKSFDPPHQGDLDLVDWCLSQKRIQKVYLHIKEHRCQDSMTSLRKKRIKMVRIAFKELKEKYPGRIIIEKSKTFSLSTLGKFVPLHQTRQRVQIKKQSRLQCEEALNKERADDPILWAIEKVPTNNPKYNFFTCRILPLISHFTRFASSHTLRHEIHEEIPCTLENFGMLSGVQEYIQKKQLYKQNALEKINLKKSLLGEKTSFPQVTHKQLEVIKKAPIHSPSKFKDFLSKKKYPSNQSKAAFLLALYSHFLKTSQRHEESSCQILRELEETRNQLKEDVQFHFLLHLLQTYYNSSIAPRLLGEEWLIKADQLIERGVPCQREHLIQMARFHAKKSHVVQTVLYLRKAKAWTTDVCQIAETLMLQENFTGCVELIQVMGGSEKIFKTGKQDLIKKFVQLTFSLIKSPPRAVDEKCFQEIKAFPPNPKRNKILLNILCSNNKWISAIRLAKDKAIESKSWTPFHAMAHYFTKQDHKYKDFINAIHEVAYHFPVQEDCWFELLKNNKLTLIQELELLDQLPVGQQVEILQTRLKTWSNEHQCQDILHPDLNLNEVNKLLNKMLSLSNHFTTGTLVQMLRISMRFGLDDAVHECIKQGARLTNPSGNTQDAATFCKLAGIYYLGFEEGSRYFNEGIKYLKKGFTYSIPPLAIPNQEQIQKEIQSLIHFMRNSFLEENFFQKILTQETLEHKASYLASRIHKKL